MTEKKSIPLLNDKDLTELQANASLMFTIKEIAIIIGCDYQHLKFNISVPQSREHAFFHRGRLEAEGKIRQSIYDLALNGSSPAQTAFLELIENSKLDDSL